MTQSTVTSALGEGLIPRREVLKIAPITDSMFKHLHRFRLVPHGIRRAVGRGTGVETFFPLETVNIIREIRRKSESGTSIAQQAKEMGISAGFPESPRMDRGWVLDQVAAGVQATRDRKQIETILGTILATGILDNQVRTITATGKEQLEFSLSDIIRPVIAKLAETIDLTLRSGMATALGAIVLDRAWFSVMESINDFERIAEDSDAVGKNALNNELEKERSQLKLIEAELQKVKAQ
jgi:hypothetical protein